MKKNIYKKDYKNRILGLGKNNINIIKYKQLLKEWYKNKCNKIIINIKFYI